MPVIICLCGKKGHGKSTAAVLLQEYGFVEICFADCLRNVVRDIFGFSDAQLHNPELKETVDDYWQITPRETLQVVGDLLRKNLPEQFPQLQDLLVRVLIKKLQSLPHQRIVVSDCRFPNEWEAMRKCGAHIVRIVRPNYVGDPKFAQHISETALDDLDKYQADTILLNDKTQAQFLEQVHTFIAKLTSVMTKP